MRTIAVPHHRAHVASVLAEGGAFDPPVRDVALDDESPDLGSPPFLFPKGFQARISGARRGNGHVGGSLAGSQAPRLIGATNDMLKDLRGGFTRWTE